MTIEQTIEKLQNEISAKVDKCSAMVEAAEQQGRDFNDDENKAFKALEAEIKVLEGRVENQKNMERLAARRARPVAPDQQKQQQGQAPAYIPGLSRKTIEGQTFVDLFKAKAVGRGNDYAALQFAEARGFKDAAYILKAATAPADMTTSGWASQLVETAYGEFLELLRPSSIFLRSPVAEAALGPNGSIVLPAMTSGIAGGFVGEGAVIPVKQGVFASTTIAPYKLKVITVATRDVLYHSNPSIDRILRDDIVRSTQVTLDTLYVDNNALSAGVRPAGLQSSATSTASGGGTGVAGIDADIKALMQRVAALNMDFNEGHFIMDTTEYNAAMFAENSTSGVKEYKDEIMAGRFFGIPVIASSSANAGVLLWVHNRSVVKLIDTSQPMQVSMSEDATLHLEDTTPLDIGVAGTPATVAAPTKSLWQTDSIGFRLVMPASWGQVRTGGVQAITGISW